MGFKSGIWIKITASTHYLLYSLVPFQALQNTAFVNGALLVAVMSIISEGFNKLEPMHVQSIYMLSSFTHRNL